LEPKWCVISPSETSARAAMVLIDAPNPSSAKHSIASSRILARAVRSDAEGPPAPAAVRMIKMLYA